MRLLCFESHGKYVGVVDEKKFFTLIYNNGGISIYG